MTDPTATEEQNHLWIDNGKGGQVNLTAEVAALIGEWLNARGDVPSGWTGGEDVANRILKIPAIAERLRAVVVTDRITK